MNHYPGAVSPPGSPAGPPAGSPAGPPLPAGRPPALVAAAAAVTLEGGTLLGYAAWLGVETVLARPENLAVAQGAAGFLGAVGALVLVVAAGLWGSRGWSRSPAVLVQLLALPVAWEMARGGLYLGAVPLAAVALVALVALFRGATGEALARRGPRRPRQDRV